MYPSYPHISQICSDKYIYSTCTVQCPIHLVRYIYSTCTVQCPIHLVRCRTSSESRTQSYNNSSSTLNDCSHCSLNLLKCRTLVEFVVTNQEYMVWYSLVSTVPLPAWSVQCPYLLGQYSTPTCLVSTVPLPACAWSVQYPYLLGK